MYKPTYFRLQELVDQETYDKWGWKAWIFLDGRILKALDILRAQFSAPVNINNWEWGGEFQYRGFRPPGKDIRVGGHLISQFSQHRFGRAMDFDVVGMTAEEVRSFIIKNYFLFEGLITAIEDDVSWVHIDCRNVSTQNKPVIFQP